MEGSLASSLQIIIYLRKFFLLVLPPDERLYDADCRQVLLNHSIDTINRLLQPAVHRRHSADNHNQNCRQHRHADGKYERQPRIHIAGHDKPQYHHDRASDYRPHSSDNCILHYGHICCESCDHGRGLKMIQIPEGIFLEFFILRLTQPRAKPSCRPGGVPGIQKAGA